LKFILVLSFTLLGFKAHAVFSNVDCMSGSDAREISRNFRGLSLGTSFNHDWICEQDIDSNTFKVLKVLEKIREVSYLEDEVSSLDDLDTSPIQENDWWSYLKNRVRDIELPRTGIVNFSCGDSITALARRPVRTITICPHFFSGFTVNDLVATVMHEVRHFDDDGHPHAVCDSGVFEGRQACDQNIHDHGSYAVGLQTLVRLAKNPNNNPLEKYELEARALYQAHNKFNEQPLVHLSESLILSTSNGDIYKKTGDNIEQVGSLPPNKALTFVQSNAYNSFVALPSDKSASSKRFLQNFKDTTEHTLVLQSLYDDELNRDIVLDIDYIGTAALLTQNQIISNCKSREITRVDLINARPQRMMDYLGPSDEPIKAVVLDDGSLLSLSCQETTLEVNETSHTLSPELISKGLVDTATINNKTYALVGDGSVFEVALIDVEIVILSELSSGEDWTSLTKYERPTIFE
jgi:hypothetical protein